MRKGGGQAVKQKEKNSYLRDGVRLEDEFSVGTRKRKRGAVKRDYRAKMQNTTQS